MKKQDEKTIKSTNRKTLRDYKKSIRYSNIFKELQIHFEDDYYINTLNPYCFN